VREFAVSDILVIVTGEAIEKLALYSLEGGFSMAVLLAKPSRNRRKFK